MKTFGKIKSKLMAIKASPQKVSKGYALGVFLGTTPFIGTKVIVALGLTTFFRWNRIASVIGVYHINILTGPLFYGTAYGVGKWLTGVEAKLILPRQLSAEWVFKTFFGSWEILKALLVGGLVLGLPMAVAAYYFSYVFLSRTTKV
jgi:hypothetical protein